MIDIKKKPTFEELRPAPQKPSFESLRLKPDEIVFPGGKGGAFRGFGATGEWEEPSLIKSLLTSREEPIKAITQIPTQLVGGAEETVGALGSMAQWFAERASIGEIATKHIDLPGVGVLSEYLVRKFGPKRPMKFYDKQMSLYASQGEKWADFWEEQAQKGWEAPDPEVMQARWRDMPVTKGIAVTTRAAPNYLVAIASSALTKNPYVGLAFISSVSGAGAYRRQRKAGAGIRKADTIATLTAAWEGITEKVPFDEVFKPAKSKFLKMIKIGTLESAQEFVQGIGENFLEYFGYKAKDLKSVPAAVKEGLAHTMDDWIENVVAGFGLGVTGAGIVPKRGIIPERPPTVGKLAPQPTPTVRKPAEAVKVPPEAKKELIAEEKQLRDAINRNMGDAINTLFKIWPTIGKELGISRNELVDRGAAFVFDTVSDVRKGLRAKGRMDVANKFNAVEAEHIRLAAKLDINQAKLAEIETKPVAKAEPTPKKELPANIRKMFVDKLPGIEQFTSGQEWMIESLNQLGYEVEAVGKKDVSTNAPSNVIKALTNVGDLIDEGKTSDAILALYELMPEKYKQVAKAEPTTEKGKYDWEMTIADKIASEGFGFGKGRTEIQIRKSLGDEPVDALLRGYKKGIQKAVSEGKTVPREVLQEYKSEKWAQEALWKLDTPTPKIVEKVEPEKFKELRFRAARAKAPNLERELIPFSEGWQVRESTPEKYAEFEKRVIKAEKVVAPKKVKGEEWYRNRWDSAKLGQRVSWIIKGKWITKKGAITKQGEKFAQTKWGELSPAVQNVMRQEIDKFYGKPPAQVNPKGDMPEIASGGVPIETPGLTSAEADQLGVGPQAALRAAQKRGLPVGYKKGYQEAALEGRRKLSILRMDKVISEKNREFVREVIQKFVPKEEHYRFMLRLSRIKDAKSVEKITAELDNFIDDYEHRGAVREFKKFVNTINKQFKRGEVKLGELSKSAKGKIAEVLDKYDTVALSEEKTEELDKHKKHIQNVAGSIARAFREWENLDNQGLDIVRLPNRRVQDLERLEKTPVKELQTEEIQYIQDELESLVSRETRKKEIRNRIKSSYAHTYVTEASNEVADRGITKRGEAKVPGIVREFFGTNQAQLRSLVRSATTKDAKATEEFLVDRVYDALSDSDGIHKEWYLYARDLFEKAGITEKTIKDLYSDIPIVLGGKKYIVPKWTLLNLWLNAEADGNLRRLLLAREHQLTRKGKTAYIGKIKLKELQDAVERLPEDFKKIGEIIFKVNREKNAPAINETSIWERGYPIAVYEKYFPFPRKLRKVPEGHRTEIQLALESRGRYMKRTGGTLPHIIKDPLIEFINGMQLDAQYHSMSIVLQDAKALLADNKWRTRMDKAGNKPIVDTLIKLYQRAEGLSTDRNIADVLAGKFLSTMGKGTLSLRPSGGFIQTASLPAAYSVIPEKYFKPSYIPKPSHAKNLMDEDATMWWRWENRRFDYVLGSQSGENSVTKLITGKDMIRDSLVKHYTWGDQWPCLKIREAANEMIEDTTELKRDSKEFKERVSKLFHRAMETQPQWDTWHRSIFTSEPRAFPRSFAMFMSARNAQYNVLLQARDDFAKGRIDKTEYGKRVGDIVEANLRVSILRRLFRKLIKYGALGLLFGIGKRDEEDIKMHLQKDLKLEARKVPTETVFNMIGLPVYGNIIANIADETIKGFEGRWSKVKYGDVRTGSVLMDFIVDIGLAHWSIGKFGKDLALQDRYKSGKRKGKLKWKYSGYEVINNLSEIVSQLTGIGYSGPRADIVWPVKEGIKPGEELGLEYKWQMMTRAELQKEIRDNTYREVSVKIINGKRDVRYANDPHRGSEKKVKRMKEILEKKK